MSKLYYKKSDVNKEHPMTEEELNRRAIEQIWLYETQHMNDEDADIVMELFFKGFHVERNGWKFEMNTDVMSIFDERDHLVGAVTREEHTTFNLNAHPSMMGEENREVHKAFYSRWQTIYYRASRMREKIPRELWNSEQSPKGPLTNAFCRAAFAAHYPIFGEGRFKEDLKNANVDFSQFNDR